MWSILRRAVAALGLVDKPATEKPLPDREGPFYFADLYWADAGPAPDFQEAAMSPSWAGFILKATQGTAYSKAPWFVKNYGRAVSTGGSRAGKDWFVGAYHFLNFNQRGVHQADYFLKVCKQAGVDWRGATSLNPVVDVEMGGEGSANRGASKAEVVRCVTEFVERVRSITGRQVILYGRGAMRDLDINEKMGCSVVWNPHYGAPMTMSGLDGWSKDDVALWQYTDGKVNGLPGRPDACPGVGHCDVSVYVDGARMPTLSSLRRRLTGRDAG